MTALIILFHLGKHFENSCVQSFRNIQLSHFKLLHRLDNLSHVRC